MSTLKSMGSADRVRVYDIHGKNNFHLEEILEGIGLENVGAIVIDMLDNVKFPTRKDCTRRPEAWNSCINGVVNSESSTTVQYSQQARFLMKVLV